MKTPDIFAGNPALLKVALCQVHTEEWAVEDNLRRVMKSLEEAAALGAELAITPECVLHGYGSVLREGDTIGRLADAAEPIDGPRIGMIRQLAARLDICVVLGFAEKDAGGRFYNSAALLTREGDVSYVYRKVHCRPFEDARYDGAFTAGDRFFVQEIAAGTGSVALGTMICFDREIPESARCLRTMGAELIACPLATDTNPIERFEYVDNEMITRCRAVENEMFIAVVNHAGRFNGGSFVVGPGGELLHQMDERPGVAVVDVPVGSVKSSFHADPLGWMGFGYRRPDVYGRYLV